MVVETTEIESDATALVERSEQIVVEDAPSYEVAGEFLLGVKAYQKNVRDLFRPHKQAANKVHKGLCDDESKHLKAPDKAEKIVKGRMGTWKEAEERAAAEERRIAEAKAREEAEKAQLAEAEAAEAAGRKAEADAILERPTEVAPVATRRAVPQVAGIKHTKRWTCEVIEGEEDLIPREFMLIDMVKLRRYATTMREQAKVTGVRFFQTGGVAAGR
jgi:hypothetical protein